MLRPIGVNEIAKVSKADHARCGDRTHDPRVLNHSLTTRQWPLLLIRVILQLSSMCDVLCGLTVGIYSRGGCLQGGAGGNQGSGERMPQTHQDVGPVRGREEGDGMSQKVSRCGMYSGYEW